MTLALIWFGGISFLELLLWIPPFWHLRKVLACLIILALSVTSGLLFGLHPSVWTGLVMVFSIYRIINLLRVLEQRMQPEYLLHSTHRSSWWLIFFQLIILIVAALLNHSAPQHNLSWVAYVISIVQLLAAFVLFSSTKRNLRKTRPPAAPKQLNGHGLPALTVAIPARNETDDLEACLRSLIGSNYSKLEILVLDDCSQSSRTPEIIRSYAHDGVRFIAGKTPPKKWLAKNYAYQQLAEAANGELLLFCGVDTRFQPGSLQSMVETLLEKRKKMLSVIPRNLPPASWGVGALMVQPGRYAWELALPRRLFQRPPVLSTCWLITKSSLAEAGGFSSVSHSISVESYFAKRAISNDGYAFIQSNDALNLTSAKSLPEQRATAIRTRYPQLRRRPELIGLLSLLELFLLIAPFGFLIGSLVIQNWILVLLNAASCALLIGFYSRIVSLTYRHFLLRGLWTLPFAVAYDIGLLNYSMWLYEFREVIWKDRNVCVPLMRVIPHLPAIPDSGKRR